jgi:hypothetical protein
LSGGFFEADALLGEGVSLVVSFFAIEFLPAA